MTPHFPIQINPIRNINLAILFIIIVIDGQDRWFFCGATIITDRWLVTAAHCIEGAAEIEVRSGCHLSNQCEMVQTACRWIIHPDYYAPVFRNDIALIQLGRPLRFGFKIQPACLPGPSLPNFEHVIVAGWGATSNNGPGSLALKEVRKRERES